MSEDTLKMTRAWSVEECDIRRWSP